MKAGKLLVNAALAGLFISGSALATGDHGTKPAGEVQCGHANSCKGKSACHGFGNASCAGKNTCKSVGYVTTKDAAACKALCEKDFKDNKECGKEEAPAKT